MGQIKSDNMIPTNISRKSNLKRKQKRNFRENQVELQMLIKGEEHWPYHLTKNINTSEHLSNQGNQLTKLHLYMKSLMLIRYSICSLWVTVWYLLELLHYYLWLLKFVLIFLIVSGWIFISWGVRWFNEGGQKRSSRQNFQFFNDKKNRGRW